MSIQCAKESVMALLKKAPLSKGATLHPCAVRNEQVEHFAKEYGFQLPRSLKEFLLLFNGVPILPDGIFGIYTELEHLDLCKIYDFIPQWVLRKWVPISTDGCGSYFIMDAGYGLTEHNPIFFIDHSDFDIPTHIVASNMWTYVKFHAEEEIRHADEITEDLYAEEPALWPYDKDYVLSIDPDIEKITAYPFPWDEE